MKILKESSISTIVDLNTDHDGLAHDMASMIKRSCPSAKLLYVKGMYYIEMAKIEVDAVFLQSFDFSRAEAKHWF